MKGVAAWIWIVVSVVLGIVVIVFGSKLIMDQLGSTQKQVAIQNFYDIYFKAKNMCLRGGVGELYRYRIALSDSVTVVYVANSTDEQPPAKVSALISSKSMTMGNFFCIKFSEENIPRCESLSCYINMTYFGTPSQKQDLFSLLARLAQGSPVFSYDLLLNKTNYSFIVITAKGFVGEKVGTTNITTS